MNARTWMLRVALCLASGFCLVVARISGEAASEADPRVSGTLLAAIVAGCSSAGLLLLAVAPVRIWRRLFDPMRRLSARMNRSSPPAHPAVGRALMLGAAAACIANLARFSDFQQNPWDDDQGAYLTRAAEIQAGGGPLGLLGSLIRGEFEEANRHPLYLVILSLRPELEFGKLLSSGLGLLTLTLSTFLVARRDGAVVAGLFAVLLSTNFAFCFFSTRVVSEILIVLFSGIVWLLSGSRGVEGRFDSTTEDGRANGPGPVRSVCAGALLGLAWLSKATGLLLLIGYLVWMALEFGRERRRLKAAGHEQSESRRWAIAAVCVCGAFLMVGSPLLTRNVRRFGNPFHNVNSLLLFADTYGEFDGMLASGTTTSDAAREFLASHTAGEMASREVTGLAWELFIIVRSLGPGPLDDSRVLFGAPLALLAVATMAVRRRPEHILLLIWGLLHWMVFAWYVPIAAGERFVLPLLIPLLVSASEAIVRLWPFERAFAAKGLLCLGILWLIVWVVATYAGTSLLTPRLS